MDAINRPVFRDGQWTLCDRIGWPDNVSFQNLLAWGWLKDEERYVIVVNLGDSLAQAQIKIPWSNVGSGAWQLIDQISGAIYTRDEEELISHGLYVELPPWNYHFFQLVRRDVQSVETYCN